MDTLSYKTISANKETANKKWVLVDAEGQTLGRICSEIAKVLRGKHKPNYTPHADCGDNVVVINAEKIVLTGKKMTDKVYLRHTGYPGGQRATTAREMMEKRPIRLVEIAVKGMLPRGPLGRAMLKKLKIYAGEAHPHAGQQPETLILH